MPDETFETRVALIREDTKHLRDTVDEFKIDFKEFKAEIKRNFVTKRTSKLEVREALNEHKEKNHRGPLSNGKLITALIILGSTAAGGASGHTIKEILAAWLGG